MNGDLGSDGGEVLGRGRFRRAHDDSFPPFLIVSGASRGGLWKGIDSLVCPINVWQESFLP